MKAALKTDRVEKSVQGWGEQNVNPPKRYHDLDSSTYDANVFSVDPRT